MVDSVSGSLSGSDPASPSSPGSSGATSPPPSQQEFVSALSSLGDKEGVNTSPHSFHLPMIKRIVNVQFVSVDMRTVRLLTERVLGHQDKPLQVGIHQGTEH